MEHGGRNLPAGSKLICHCLRHAQAAGGSSAPEALLLPGQAHLQAQPPFRLPSACAPSETESANAGSSSVKLPPSSMSRAWRLFQQCSCYLPAQPALALALFRPWLAEITSGLPARSIWQGARLCALGPATHELSVGCAPVAPAARPCKHAEPHVVLDDWILGLVQ